MDKLSPREYQVAMLVARGWRNKQIARELDVSLGTVKSNVHDILIKLGVENSRRRHAVQAEH